jgi:hypothetical protein
MEPRDSTSSESEFFLVMSRIVSKLSNFCANPVTFERKMNLLVDLLRLQLPSWLRNRHNSRAGQRKKIQHTERLLDLFQNVYISFHLSKRGMATFHE